MPASGRKALSVAVVVARVMKLGAAIARQKSSYATDKRVAGVVGVQEVAHVERRHLPCLCSYVRSLIKKMSIKDYITTNTGLSHRSTGETNEQLELPLWQEKMNGKPVIYRPNARTVLNLKSSKFEEKLLCDGITLNPGDACAYSCEFCYVEGQMIKLDKRYLDELNEERRARRESTLAFEQVVICRPNSLELLRSQLFNKRGRPKFTNPNDNRVVYGSTLVDVAANMKLLRETAELCNLILENTAWQIRLLSKSSLLHRLFKDDLIPARHRHRMILGFSSGTLDDEVAKAVETGTARVSKRIESLHWLQDEGYRTFGMICPSLPQMDGCYRRFSDEICGAIRVDRCEHVWAEVINLRGRSLVRTLAALHRADLESEAAALSAVMGTGNKEAWEQYARATFLAHTKNVPAEKLRFLQYVDEGSADWWAGHRGQGAVLLGKIAMQKNLTASAK